MAVTTKFVAIKYGDKGTNVRECQKLLKAAGSTLKVDGKFGIGMVSAVRAFQKKNALPVTGIIDAKTYKKLSAKKPAKK